MKPRTNGQVAAIYAAKPILVMLIMNGSREQHQRMNTKEVTGTLSQPNFPSLVVVRPFSS